MHDAVDLRFGRSSTTHLFAAISALAFCLLFCPSPLLAEQAGVSTSITTATAELSTFFPIGLYTYEVTPAILSELCSMGFDTVVNGFKPEDIPLIEKAGMRFVCPPDDAFFSRAVRSPSLLAWYLVDEPEGHGNTTETLRDSYTALKRRDPAHRVGVCHFLLDAIARFKDSGDFTMPDVYPVTANRDVPMANIGIHMDEARRVHGRDWPVWPFIQVFGGPKTDGGKWAVPTPAEVRCMVFIALVHRANGLLYFSYWPQAKETWASVAQVNSDVRKLLPWLTSRAQELPATSSAGEVQVRAHGSSSEGILLAVNTSRTTVTTDLKIPAVGISRFTRALGAAQNETTSSALHELFSPLETKAWVWGNVLRKPRN